MKKKRKKIMKILIACLLLLLIVVILYFVILSKKDLKIDRVVIEYGSQLSLDYKKLFDEKKVDLKSIELDDTNVKYSVGNYPEVGEYEVSVKYINSGRERKATIKIIVKDTTIPKFVNLKSEIKLAKGSKDVDFTKYFEFDDFSEVKISVDDSKVLYDEVGIYKIQVVGTDLHGNKVEQEVNLEIVEMQTSINGITCTSKAVEPMIVKGILIVNKKYPLPCGYAPGEDATAGSAIREMIAEMQLLGFGVLNNYSGYRSFETQNKLYNNYVARDGKAAADTYSARAGHSEHQTGLAFDLIDLNGSLVPTGTKEALWIAENAHRYGFIVRYQKNKEHITGYKYEPWHLRYIGNIAEDVYKSEKTLEEYLGVDGGDYEK